MCPAHSGHGRRVVALKIVTIRYTAVAQKEIQLLSTVRRSDAQVQEGRMPPRPSVVELYEYFKHVGPYGQQMCITFNLRCPLLYHFICRFTHRTLLPRSRCVSHNLLHSLDFLHFKSCIIHTCLKTENLLFDLPPQELSRIKGWTTGPPQGTGQQVRLPTW